MTLLARLFSTVLLGMLLGVLTLASGAVFSAPASKTSGEKIIVSGASGNLGSLVVEELLGKGVAAGDLILVSRSPDELKDFASRGAQVRYGDFTKPQSLPAAFAGGSKMLLISISGGVGSRAEAHGHAIDAAVKAGVKHIAYTSWIGLSRGDASGIGADHQATEELLRKSGIAWTMLRNSLYAEIALGQATQMGKTGRAVATSGATGIGYVARKDCAAAAAAVLTTDSHAGKSYDITGPELVGVPELARLVAEVTGREVKVAPPEPGAPPARAFGGPALAVVSADVEKLTGRPATTMRQVLEANRDGLTRIE